MMKNQIIIGAAVVAVFILLAFQFSFAQPTAPAPAAAPAVTPAPPPPTPVGPPGPTLKMSISSPQIDVTVGDMIQIDLVITNMAATNTDIIKPMIDIDSVTFSIRLVPITGTEQPWSFVFSRIAPSVYDHNRSQLERITLGANGTSQAVYKTTFTLPAITIAYWQITAFYQGGQVFMISEPLHFRVIGPKSELQGGELVTHIETISGTMTGKFYFKDAPNTVMNFVKLAKEGKYNNLIFHRIIAGFMIRGGDPKGDGSGGSGYSIKSEVNSHHHQTGTMAMAHSGIKPERDLDSAGCQFYICLASRPDLDKDYTTFGELVSGQEVLDAIGSVATTGAKGNPPDRPLEAIIIKSITVEYMGAK